MKNSFVLYTDYREHVKLLSNEQKGELFTAILDYAAGEDPALEGMPLMAFSFIKAQMDRDSAIYEEKLTKRMQSGKKGGRPKKENAEEDCGSDEDEDPEQCKKAKKANGFFSENEKAKKANGFLDDDEKANGFFAFEKNPDTVTDNDTDTDTDTDTVYLNTLYSANQKGKTENQMYDARELNVSPSRSLFDQFWSAYPVRVREKSALTEWEKLHMSQQLFREIMNGLERALNSAQWQEEEGRYIPYPENFLKNGLWKVRYKSKRAADAFVTMQERPWDLDKLEEIANVSSLSERGA